MGATMKTITAMFAGVLIMMSAGAVQAETARPVAYGPDVLCQESGFNDSLAGLPIGYFGGTLPRVDVRETPERIQVFAEVPGLGKEDIEYFIQDNKLTLRGQKPRVPESSSVEKWHACERAFGGFERIVPMPVPVDVDSITASIEKGVIQIDIVKSMQAHAQTRAESRR